MSEFILEMEHIVKKFPGVLALNDVDFSLRRGEVHVLLGENGAGKSTLVKILCGAYSKDSGRILLNGREVDFPDTRSAQKAGIAVIYQEFNLFPHLSVAENLFAGRPFLKGGTSLIDWSRIFDEAEQALQRVGLEIDPHLSVHELTVAQQQLLEIAKALTLDAKIIIMDEPTSALTESEIETLFDRIRELKSQGVSIIYISHRMDEIKRIGDRATVLRDGARVATVELSETSDDQLVQYMIGRRLEEKFPRGSVTVGETLLDVRGLSTDNGLKDISFSLRRGEILGIFGLLGSGRTELARAIFGADESASGSILIGGNERTIRRPLDAIRCKVALLPEDRRRHGLLLPMCVMHNITLSSLNKVSRGFA